MPRADTSPAVLAVVLAGGCAGGLARHGLTALPGGLLLANALGALLLGLLLVAVAHRRWWVRPALGTGFCGAFTTMSAVAVAAQASPVALLVHGVAGLAAAATGALLGRRWR